MDQPKSGLAAGFPARLAEARAGSGLGIRAIAAMADVTPNTIRLYLNGQREPQISTVERLAEAMSTPDKAIDPRWLAYG